MAKKLKLSTPEWIMEGYDSKADWEKARQKAEPLANSSKLGQVKGIKGKKKGKSFSIKVCPKCGSKEVGIVLGGGEGKGSKGWECKKCGWKGKEVGKLELNEDEFMKYLDDKGEEVA